MIKKIGKIKLNYQFYSGVDLYSDGDIEDDLLKIVKSYKPSEYNKVIAEKNEWAILYHLSHLRGNIIEWMPITKNETVLEIGAGCGAITGVLAEKAKYVKCIELSERRSLINAYRNKEKENIEIILGNFEDIEKQITDKYDYITLIGVLEYGEKYISSETPYETFLALLKQHLKPEGKLVIAIENKFGMKYWAGCKEDHTGKYFEGIEGYSKSSGVKTFSMKVLQDLIHSVGFQSCKFYYPYPDYKLPMVIYSDDYLPKKGELKDNIRNFDEARMILFDEAKAFDAVIDEGRFPLFSNSYLVIAQNGGEEA